VSNDDALALVGAQIARLHAAGQAAEEAAPDVAQALRRELDANIAAGVDPGGKAWQPTADGHKPLRGAADNLSVRAIGRIIVARLTGYHARHHFGDVRGGVQRQILPSRSQLGPLLRATRDVVMRKLATHLRGDG